MRPLLPCFAIVALCACGGPSLGTAPSTELQLNPTTDSSGNHEGFQVWLQYDDEGGCMTLSNQARATINGVDSPRIFRGGGHLTGTTDFGYHCKLVGLDVPLSMIGEPETTFVIEDEGIQVVMALRNLGGPLSVAVTPPADGHIRRGSTVGLVWSPATDDLSDMKGFFRSAKDATGHGAALTLGGSVFQQGLTIPDDAQPGTATLDFWWIRAPQITRCEGVDTCDSGYPLSHEAPQPLERVLASFEIEP